MDDQKEIKKLLPVWRKSLIRLYTVGEVVVEFILSPYTWVIEQVDGTSELRKHL